MKKVASIFATSLVLAASAQAQIVIPAFSTPYVQDFDTLANTGTSSTLPSGWFFSESGTASNTTYTAGTGSSTTGDTYSFGSSSSQERALGGLQSGSLIPLFGAQFQNGIGSAIDGLQITYTGEQWRLGALGRVDRLDFQYSLDATSLTTGIWFDSDGLDFVAPTTTGSTGALDGNNAVNRSLLSQTITGLSIPDGGTFWIRWSDLNASGSDDGLGIDTVSVLATPVPEPYEYALVSGLGLFGFALIRRQVFKRA